MLCKDYEILIHLFLRQEREVPPASEEKDSEKEGDQKEKEESLQVLILTCHYFIHIHIITYI